MSRNVLILVLFLNFILACGSMQTNAINFPSFSGANQYYLFYKSQKMVDEIFDDAKELNLQVIRTWAFCDGNYFTDNRLCFQPKPYEYNETAFKNLDYVIYKAKQNNIQLILALANNWKDFGGIPQYLSWFHLKEHDDFYRDNRTKDVYKAYVKYVLNRVNTLTGIAYKDDPTILAWELMNEPKSTNLPLLYDWVDEMASYIKEIDSKHLITTGSEGAISGSVFDMHKSKAIDFISFHLYPDHWKFTLEEAKQYIKKHIRISRLMNKPLFLGEFGFQDKKQRNQIYKEWYTLFEQEKIDGVAFWLLSGYQDDGTLYPDYDGYTIYYPEDSDVITTIKEYGQRFNRDML